MRTIDIEHLQEFRRNTFRSSLERRIQQLDQAVEFVNERGFIFFWPIQGVICPSLWTAVAGDRPVADNHDDPGHVTWGWKDSLLGGRGWYYAKVLRRRSTIISFDVLPYFYALSENYGSPGEDYLTQYQMGRMTQEAKSVYEILLEEGPLNTISLRRKARLTGKSSESRFSSAIAYLQADFKILPVAVTDSGAWRYAFAYDIVTKQYPELESLAHPIQEQDARDRLLELYFESVGAARRQDVTRLFGWSTDFINASLTSLLEKGILRHDISLEGFGSEVVALARLID